MAMTAKKNGERIEIYENGYPTSRNITVPGLLAVSCDGEYVGALRDDRVDMYACATGYFIRTINQRSSSVQVSGGMLILQVNGRTEEYNIANGNLEHIY
ncbi:MAG: hypothetical protein V8T90_16205 [Victivallales bacterium]